MKVSELINKLQSLPVNADILCCIDENEEFKILDILDTTVVEATRIRIKGEPFLRLEKSENSEQHVLISITAEF